MTDIELRNENGKIVGYDSNGNKIPVSFEDGNFDSLDTYSLSHDKSHWHGATVYYDPRDRGPYVDGADALADVPDGGLIRIVATDYDVANEGRLSTDRPLTIYAKGWDKETVRARLVSRVVEAPCIGNNALHSMTAYPNRSASGAAGAIQ